MQLRNSLVPLLLALSVLSAGCEDGPAVTVFVSDVSSSGLQGFSQASGKHSFVPWTASDRFVCFSPPDAQTLLKYCQEGAL